MIQLLPDIYWHIARHDMHSVMLFNNATLRHGYLPTVSEMRKFEGGSDIAARHDYAPALGHEREGRLEEVRQANFPQKPTRSGALWLFEDPDQAVASAKTWFPNQEFHMLEARVAATSRVHRGHLGWFEDADIDASAIGYWAGEANPRPPGHWEIVVNGVVYFPGWQKPPFGLDTIAKMLRSTVSSAAREET